MGAYAAAAGAIIGGIGSVLGAGEARTKKNQLRDLANTPGLDIDSEIANALGSDVKNLPGASTVAGGVNTANSANMRALLESGIPGYEALQGQVTGNIASELRGEFDPEIQALLDRKAAAYGVTSGGGGFFTGGNQRNYALRDIARTAYGQKEQGQKDFLSLLGGTPLPGLVGAQNFLGPSISDRIGIRSNERTQRLQMLSGSILAPSGTDVIANYLQKTGGALMGGGLSNMGIGGSAGGGGNGLNVQSGGANYSSQFGGG